MNSSCRCSITRGKPSRRLRQWRGRSGGAAIGICEHLESKMGLGEIRTSPELQEGNANPRIAHGVCTEEAAPPRVGLVRPWRHPGLSRWGWRWSDGRCDALKLSFDR